MESIKKSSDYQKMKLNQIHPDYDANSNPTPYDIEEINMEMENNILPEDIPYDKVSASASGAKNGDFVKISNNAQEWWNEEGTHLEVGEKDYGDGIKLIYKVNDETGEKTAMGFVNENDLNAKTAEQERIKNYREREAEKNKDPGMDEYWKTQNKNEATTEPETVIQMNDRKVPLSKYLKKKKELEQRIEVEKDPNVKIQLENIYKDTFYNPEAFTNPK